MSLTRTATRLLLTGVLVAFFALQGAFAHAAPSSINAQIAENGASITVRGTLTSEGSGIGGARLVASIGSRTIAETTTAGDGSFTLSFVRPADLPVGQHQLLVSFHGTGAAEATSAAATLNVTQAQAAIPPPAAGAPQLKLHGPQKAQSGDAIDLTGSLTDAGGRGIANAGISVSDATGEVKDSYAVTGADGSFRTFYQIPEDHPKGDLTVTARFNGGSGIAPAAAQVKIPVSVADVVSPDDTSSEEPLPEPTATPTSAEPSPSPEPTKSAAPVSASQGTGMWTPFLLALIGVGGVAVIAFAVIAFRGRFQQPAAADEVAAPLELLDELSAPEEPAAQAPPAVAPVTWPGPVGPAQGHTPRTPAAQPRRAPTEGQAAPPAPVRPAPTDAGPPPVRPRRGIIE